VGYRRSSNLDFKTEKEGSVRGMSPTAALTNLFVINMWADKLEKGCELDFVPFFC